MVDFLDADTRNADWIKQTGPGAWDVDMPDAAEIAETMSIEDIEFLMSLPVWSRAPKPVRDAAAKRLAEVAD